MWKYNRAKTTHFVFIIILILLCSFQLQEENSNSINNEIYAYYKRWIDSTQKTLLELKYATIQKQPQADLKKYFLSARRCYKRGAFLSEYVSPYTNLFINGPALPRIEEGLPDKIIDPHGFQVIEEIIYGKSLDKTAYSKIASELNLMQDQMFLLSNAYDIKNAFTVRNIYHACRLGVISLAAKEITGFESPLAGNALPECIAMLDGLDSISQYLCKEDIALRNTIYKTRDYIKNNNSFDTFDRITFIKKYVDTLSAQIHQEMVSKNIFFLKNVSAISDDSKTLFDLRFFNLEFFSPSENHMPSQQRIALGEKLFFDPILSKSNTISCASCHNPSLAFTDGQARATTIDKSNTRNTPSLFNAVLQTRFFYDMREESLEDQFIDVVHNVSEMNGSISQIIERLKNDSTYKQLFNNAYSKEVNPISPFTIANAVANYERTLISYNSRFDKFMRNETNIFSEEEKKGFNLFMGKAKCGTCHFAPLFNGLMPPNYADMESEIIGVPLTKQKKNAQIDRDKGRYNFTKSGIHKYSFRTPGLRNIELTAPYMHNGVYQTLEEVMEFYNNAGGNGLGIHVTNSTLPEAKLELNKTEIKQIITFLKTLTDTSLAIKR